MQEAILNKEKTVDYRQEPNSLEAVVIELSSIAESLQSIDKTLKTLESKGLVVHVQ